MCGLPLSTEKCSAQSERLYWANSGETQHTPTLLAWIKCQQSRASARKAGVITSVADPYLLSQRNPVKADFTIMCSMKGYMPAAAQLMHPVIKMVPHSPIPVSGFQINYFGGSLPLSVVHPFEELTQEITHIISGSFPPPFT